MTGPTWPVWNLTAGWHLIRTCDKLLRAAPAGRAVVLTDELARDPRAYWGAYLGARRRAALEHLWLTWAAETRTTRLRVNLFEPWPNRDAASRPGDAGEDPRSLPLPAHIAPARRSPRCAVRSRRGTARSWVLMPMATPGDRFHHTQGRVPHRGLIACPCAASRHRASTRLQVVP